MSLNPGEPKGVYDWVEYEEACFQCGERLELRQCKAVCPNCGFTYPCTDA